MRRSHRRALILVALLSILWFGPLLIPVPRLQGTTPVEALIDPDGRFLARLPQAAILLGRNSPPSEVKCG